MNNEEEITTNKTVMQPSLPNKRTGSRLLAYALVAIMVCLGACSSERTSYSEYVDVPSWGWTHGTPLYFTPQFADSTLLYDVTFAVRHTNSYPYSNLDVTLDFVADDSKVQRMNVDFSVSDEIGRWKGAGFGAYYQLEKTVARGVTVDRLKRIVAWQSMSGCDTLKYVQNVGVIITPTGAKH